MKPTNVFAKICSGCGEIKPDVNRSMYDGLCQDCVTTALYNKEYFDRAKRRNAELIQTVQQSNQ